MTAFCRRHMSVPSCFTLMLLILSLLANQGSVDICLFKKGTCCHPLTVFYVVAGPIPPMFVLFWSPSPYLPHPSLIFFLLVPTIVLILHHLFFILIPISLVFPINPTYYYYLFSSFFAILPQSSFSPLLLQSLVFFKHSIPHAFMLKPLSPSIP